MPSLRMEDGKAQKATAVLEFRVLAGGARTDVRTFFVFANLPVDVIIGSTTCDQLGGNLVGLGLLTPRMVKGWLLDL